MSENTLRVGARAVLCIMHSNAREEAYLRINCSKKENLNDAKYALVHWVRKQLGR